MISLVETEEVGARIKVFGIGGGGGNAINTMIRSGLRGVEFLAANTDAQALKGNLAPVKVHLGEKGLGAGANPDVGRAAAEARADAIRAQIEGADMVFITAGMGGGTGTGGAPIVGRIARELGVLTVGVVTRPFEFEGKRRGRQAEEGIVALKESVDTLIVIPNERLLAVTSKKATMLETFQMADDVLLHAVRGIADLITVHGVVNLDFADVRTIMADMGMAIMGSGSARGDHRAVEAAQRAISSPLLEDISIQGARGVLINITGSADVGIHEINQAASLIREQAHDDANIIFGAVIDENMGDEIRITVIATGFGGPVEVVEPVPESVVVVRAPEPPPPPPAPRVYEQPAPPVVRPTVRVSPAPEPQPAPTQQSFQDRTAAPRAGSLFDKFKWRSNGLSTDTRGKEGRPVVRMGRIVGDEAQPRLEPRVEPQPRLERMQIETSDPSNPPEREFVLGETDEDALDTPAFMRRHAQH